MFDLETIDQQRRPAITIGLSSAAATAVVMVLAHAVFGDAIMPGRSGAMVSAAVFSEIKTALVDHQSTMVKEAELQEHAFERIEQLLTVMCVQQAKMSAERDACLRR